MSAPSYRFQMRIVDAATGSVIEADFFTMTGADSDFECVRTHAGQMLRNWRNFARAEHESDLETEAA